MAWLTPELGLAEYFVSLYPKPMQANYHHERTQHVGTGDFHYCNNWPSSKHRETLEFATQHLCLIAERQLESLTEPIVSEGLVRYEVVGTCVQVSESKKK